MQLVVLEPWDGLSISPQPYNYVYPTISYILVYLLTLGILITNTVDL